MAEQYEFEGHTIEVRTRKVGNKWTWDFTIDGGHFKENTEELAPIESIATHEALAHAQGIIRGLK